MNISLVMDGLSQAALDASAISLLTLFVFLGIRLIAWLSEAL